MDLTTKSKQHIELVADEALAQFERIATAAKSKLSEGLTLAPEALASVNTMTQSSTIQELHRISEANRDSYAHLTDEPAVARVLVATQDGKKRTFYICRATPPSGFPDLVSHHAQAGRLASLPVGEEFTLKDGTVVEVLERAQLRPASTPDGWDSRNTVLQIEHFGPVTIESLRAFLPGITDDLLGQLLAEESRKDSIIEGVRRSVITKMGLRDQPILDQFQDEIFRLPLDKRLFILGPPGTGKTTTLIRRLGQKLDTPFLEEREQRLVESIKTDQGVPHPDSWLMFTPTDLLKQYLKEAFARERVPASDLRIRTWQEHRHELARNTFSVLRTASGGGTFVLNDAIQSLNAEALNRPIEWYSDFDAWQRNAYVQDMRSAAALLCEAKVSDAHAVGELFTVILEKADDETLASTFGALAKEAPQVQAIVANQKEASDRKIKGALNLQLNRDKTFLDELARLIDGLQQAQITDLEEPDDLAPEEEEEASAPRTGRAAALNAYMQAVRAQARAAASKRVLSNTSRNGKIIEWLGGRSLAVVDRREVGASLLVQTGARPFVSPAKRYIANLPRRYRAFRRLRQQENTWYFRDGFEARDIHSLELDVLVLAILRAASELISRPDVRLQIENPAWSSLKSILGIYRNQILVDEATDFSPIQLACMAALTDPRLRSFFACGDFNQRLTTWGVRSTDDLKWVFLDLEMKQITISYRQSKQLNDFARATIRAVGGTELSVSRSANVDSEGVAPALLEGAGGESVVRWLADRIREIERLLGQLPSIAIFVNTEESVGKVAAALNAALAEHNIRVIACHEGLGQETSVRVFDVQHIKGLEFEAAFFIAIDQLADLRPELFGKYLYVGTTRAATYLGVTCERTLPPAIEDLRPLFCQDWRLGI